MLGAIYYARVIEVLEQGKRVYKIDEDPLPPGITFKIVAYAQKSGYTLTLWVRGDEEEAIAGETLWHRDSPILTGGGQLSLYRYDAPDSKRLTRLQPADVWDAHAQGEIQISDAIARSLRENLIYFKL